MADWFKFYNDNLDSAGMQYCLSEQPLAASVWLLILSEASKNRLASLSWDTKDFRLLGFSRKLNISPGIFNQCLGLLQHAGYITISDQSLVIPGWDKMQSDYAKGLDRGYYKKTSERLASVSEVSTVRGEERRGEEKRGEKNRKEEKKKVASLPRFQKPSIEAIKLQAAKIGLSDLEAEKFFNYYESNGWRVGKNPMKSWPGAMANWKLNAYSAQKNGTAVTTPSVFNLKTVMEQKQKLADQLRNEHSTTDALSTTWDDPAYREQYRALRGEIKELQTKLAGAL